MTSCAPGYEAPVRPNKSAYRYIFLPPCKKMKDSKQRRPEKQFCDEASRRKLQTKCYFNQFFPKTAETLKEW